MPYRRDDDPAGLHVEAFISQHERRVRAHARRVARELAARGLRLISRGRRPVVRSDGVVFASVSEAARMSGIRKVDNVSQAIARGGNSGGYSFRYLDPPPEPPPDTSRCYDDIPLPGRGPGRRRSYRQPATRPAA
jgi:hypothetical protein